jgi:hypothetical protein
MLKKRRLIQFCTPVDYCIAQSTQDSTDLFQVKNNTNASGIQNQSTNILNASFSRIDFKVFIPTETFSIFTIHCISFDS